MNDERGEYDASGGGGHGNGGVIAGLLAALGAGGIGLADDCARLGARSARSIDEVAIAGTRTGGLLDDGARGGARGLANDIVRGEANAGAWIDDAGRPRLVVHPNSAAGDEASMLESLGDFAIDVGFEVAGYEFDVSESLPERPPLTRSALVIDLDANAWAWTRLADPNTQQPAAGPWIFTGRNDGEGLIIGEQTISVREMANTCRVRGATCVFVGCTSNCASESERVFNRARGHDGRPLDHFTIEYAAARLKTANKPNFVVVSTDALTIMRAR